MECRQCGTEIAANALICFRCGAATDEPAQPERQATRARRGWAPVALGVVYLLVLAFFASLAVGGQAVPPAVWMMLSAAGVLLTWRMLQ